jgi:PleD family two-component response regulator
MGQRILQAVHGLNIRYQDRVCTIQASVGIGFGSPATTTCSPDDLLAVADKAMYAVKAKGKNGFQLVKV